MVSANPSPWVPGGATPLPGLERGIGLPHRPEHAAVSASIVSRAWVSAGFSADFPQGVLKSVTVDDEPLVAWRSTLGSVAAASAYCPHRGARLDGPTAEEPHDGVITCPFHGARFDTSGAVVPTPTAPKCDSLRVMRTVEFAGQVVCTENEDLLEPSDLVPEDTEVVASYELACRSPMPDPWDRYLAISDNLFDNDHVQPVHRFAPGLRVTDVDGGSRRLDVTLVHDVGNRQLTAHRAAIIPGLVVLETPLWGGGTAWIIEAIGYVPSGTIIRTSLLLQRTDADNPRRRVRAAELATLHEQLMRQDLIIWDGLDTRRGSGTYAFSRFPAALAFFDAIAGGGRR